MLDSCIAQPIRLGLHDSCIHYRYSNISIFTGVTAVAAGAYHTCAALNGGNLWCWGSNYYGQLGTGSSDSEIKPTNVTFDEGYSHSQSKSLYHPSPPPLAVSSSLLPSLSPSLTIYVFYLLISLLSLLLSRSPFVSSCCPRKWDLLNPIYFSVLNFFVGQELWTLNLLLKFESMLFLGCMC